MSTAVLRPLRRKHTSSFLCPVREASGAGGHWVTIGGGGSDDAEGEGHGGVHVFISSAGAIEKGPRSLVGQHVAAIAHHPAAGKLKHHPVGHEPPGARDHPHYIEREVAAKAEAEPAKRPGKPYARLHGAEQGTRHEQITKALGAAQEAARRAKAAPPKPDIAALERAERQARSDYIAASTSHRKNPARHEAARQAHASALKALQDAQAGAPEHRVADAAVAHQQAQADLAAHRAAHDRNPNPWAPHLSPPVGDAKDRQLAEKATRAQLAHQAAQAQQQGAQQQQQTQEQRAHEKEMVRLKHEHATEQSARAAGASASDARILANQVRAGHGLIRGKRPHNPEQLPALTTPQPRTAPRDDAPIVMPDGSTRTREQYDMAQAVGKDAADRQMRAAGRSTWNEDDYSVFARTMNDHLERNLTMGSAAANRARAKTKARESTDGSESEAREAASRPQFIRPLRSRT